jgi:hypothetical protein
VKPIGAIADPEEQELHHQGVEEEQWLVQRSAQ